MVRRPLGDMGDVGDLGEPGAESSSARGVGTLQLPATSRLERGVSPAGSVRCRMCATDVRGMCSAPVFRPGRRVGPKKEPVGAEPKTALCRGSAAMELAAMV